MTKPRIAVSVTLAALAIASSGCSSTPHQNYPPRVDLVRAGEPQITEAAMIDEKAANDFDNAVMAWGRGLDQQVGRLCSWAKRTGMKDAPC